MSTLKRRLATLEGRTREDTLSPWGKQWLGIPLSADEQKRVENERQPEFDGDLSKLSKEVREWLEL
jgi:hypothetical protein